MKDTVSDMRKHIWPAKEQISEQLTQIEEKADEKIQQLRDKIGVELTSVMDQVGRTDSKITGHPTMRRRFSSSMVMESLAILLRDQLIEAKGNKDELDTIVRVRQRPESEPDQEGG